MDAPTDQPEARPSPPSSRTSSVAIALADPEPAPSDDASPSPAAPAAVAAVAAPVTADAAPLSVQAVDQPAAPAASHAPAPAAAAALEPVSLPAKEAKSESVAISPPPAAANIPTRESAGIFEPMPAPSSSPVKKFNLDARPSATTHAASPPSPKAGSPKGSSNTAVAPAAAAASAKEPVQLAVPAENDPAAIVHCTAKDVKCPWTGRRDLLSAHTSTCPHEALRPLLTELLRKIADLEAHDKVSVPALRGCFVDKDTRLITTIARCAFLECNREFCYSWFPTAETPDGTYTPNECPHCERASLPPERLIKAARNPASADRFYQETKPIQGLGIKPEMRGCVIIPEGRLAASLHKCEGCNKDFYIMYSFVAKTYTPSGCIFCRKRTLPEQRLVMATQLPL